MMDKFSTTYDCLESACGTIIAGLLVVLMVVFVLGISFGWYCFVGWVFMVLWNWLAVTLLNAPVLGYWMCVAIVFALRLLRGLIFPNRSSSN